MNAAKLGALATILLTTPASAQVSVAPQMSTIDEQAVDAIIAPVIDGLVTQRHKFAISDYFLTNPRMKEKTGEIELFQSQVDGAFALYGKISSCQLTEKKSYGTVAQRRLYICQHDSYLTRWVFDALKSSRGWIAGNMRYDDKYTLDLSQ